MKATSVHCNHCGAPLEISDSTQFTTCNYCGSRLRIQRTESSVFSEVLDEIAARSDRIEEDLEAVRLQNEIEKLDREWETRKQDLCERGEHGALLEPTMQLEVQYVLGVIIGIAWMALAHGQGAPFPFVLIGLIGVICTVFRLFTLRSQVAAYNQEKQAYLNRRAQLERELASHGLGVEVYPTGKVVSSKALDGLASRTETLQGDVSVVRLQKEIELLDRDWGARKKQMGISELEEETGRAPDPKRLLFSTGTLLLIAAALVIFGALCHVALASTIAMVPALGACGLLVLILRAPKVTAYVRERQAYRSRRAKLSQQLGLAWQQSSKNNQGVPESLSTPSPPSRTQR